MKKMKFTAMGEGEFWEKIGDVVDRVVLSELKNWS